MSDIVERLRQGVDPDDIQETEKTMDMGADKIERLQTALKEIAEWPGGKYLRLCDIARRALEEKE